MSGNQFMPDQFVVQENATRSRHRLWLSALVLCGAIVGALVYFSAGRVDGRRVSDGKWQLCFGGNCLVFSAETEAGLTTVVDGHLAIVAAESQSLASELATCHSQADASNKHILRLERSLEAERSQRDDLERQSSELGRQLNDAEGALAESTVQREALKARTRDLLSQIESLAEENELGRRAVAAAEKQEAALRDQFSFIVARAAAAEDAIDRQSKILSECKAGADAAAAAARRTDDRLAAANVELGSLKAALAQHDGEIGECQTNLIAARREADQRTAEYAALRNQFALHRIQCSGPQGRPTIVPGQTQQPMPVRQADWSLYGNWTRRLPHQQVIHESTTVQTSTR